MVEKVIYWLANYKYKKKYKESIKEKSKEENKNARILKRLMGVYKSQESEGISKLRRFQLVSFSEISDELSKSYKIYDCSKGEVYVAPHIFHHDEKIVNVDIPALYVNIITDAEVVGETNIVIKGDYLIHDLAAQNIDRVSIEYGDLIYASGRNAVLADRDTDVRTIDKGINLLQAGNHNYFHFVIETLSKLVLVDKIESLKEIPLLVDSIVLRNKSFRDALERCNYLKHPIIYIDKNQRAIIKELVCATGGIFMPGNVYNPYSIKIEDFSLSNTILNELRDRMTGNYAEDEYGKKIIISRKNTTNSRLTNEDELVKILKKNGFKVIYPEALSLEEQSNVFFHSKEIFTASGAALTNMIFCRPGTKVYCIIPKEHKFYMYSTMARALGIDFWFVNARITQKESYNALDKFEVDLKDIKDLFN